jgi:hypothetical protein
MALLESRRGSSTDLKLASFRQERVAQGWRGTNIRRHTGIATSGVHARRTDRAEDTPQI